LQNFGADIKILNQAKICNETVGDLLIRGRESFAPQTDSNRIDGDVIANLIDEIPILAIFGTQMKDGLEVRGASELRVKESDRIAAIVENLRRMNASVEEFADGFRIEKSDLKGAQIDSFGDHRIAMAFSIAALFADGETQIINAECAGVSFPEFYQTLAQIIK
jgi:3-phosphoshikimate 1-carboxyvinyltransferase